ncbi:MAG TPA: hypothetical protein VEC19_06805 [Usitatibacter sp.]|nr:hypothetical protein [Usitatibacter sp.]
MNWLRALEQAQTVDAVLEVVNEFLSQHSDDFWSWVPRASRPERIGQEDELHRWHRDLVQQLTQAKSPNVRMQDVCVFFVRASVRVHQIRERSVSPRPSNDGQVSTAPGSPRARRR